MEYLTMEEKAQKVIDSKDLHDMVDYLCKLDVER